MDGDRGNIFSCLSVRCLGALQHMLKLRNNTQHSTKKSAERQYSNTWQTRVKKETRSSAEFCTQEKGDLDNTASTWTKRNLKQWDSNYGDSTVFLQYLNIKRIQQRALHNLNGRNCYDFKFKSPASFQGQRKWSSFESQHISPWWSYGRYRH
jgi:hypothetical protein